MYNIYFYKDKDGKEPVAEYIMGLSGKKDKDSRIKLNKIRDYIKVLSEYGTKVGEPYLKHVDGDIWELRPLREREIEKAKRELSDLIERGMNYE